MNEQPRRFSSSQRVALYLAAGGNCAECGADLSRGWNADHYRKPWCLGGETDVNNGQALCPTCNRIKGATVELELRDWQITALEQFERSVEPDFLMVATPGAGKTIFAAAVARNVLRIGVTRIVIVVPSDHLRRQWAEKFDAARLEIQPSWLNAHTVWPCDFHGVAVTYAQVASEPQLFRKITADAPTLVILDEIHHCGTKKSWGAAILTAFEPARVRLMLSGTPFRSDGARIPFVRYVDNSATADGTYGYDRAIRDGVCRPVFFPRRGGRMEWVGAGGAVQSASFDDDLSEEQESKRLRTALSASGDWMRAVLAEANTQLEEYRAEDSDAAGLVVTIDQEHAKAVGRLLEQVTGIEPVVAVSEDPEASNRIEKFTKSKAPWIVAVRMISEGVDIPRLRVCVYGTNVVSELAFRQVVGRVVRVEADGADHTAAVFIPDDSRLRAMAEEIKQQRDHAIEEETRELLESEARDDGTRAKDPSLFMPLSSEMVDRGVIFDSANFPPDEIARVRALKAQVPGLSGDDVQLAQLLRLAGATSPGRPDSEAYRAPKRDRVSKLRKQNTFHVKQIVRIHLAMGDAGAAHQKVNGLLNIAVGIKSLPQATEAQLERRLTLAKVWLETGKGPGGA